MLNKSEPIELLSGGGECEGDPKSLRPEFPNAEFPNAELVGAPFPADPPQESRRGGPPVPAFHLSSTYFFFIKSLILSGTLGLGL